jgi:cell division protein FtsL
VARSTPRARRSVHPRFAVLSALVVTLALVGLVSLQAVLAQSSFHAAELQAHITDLSGRYGVLTSEEAKLSAPGRVQSWALAHGMRPADVGHLVIITVPSRDAHTGTSDATLGRDSALVKAIVGSAG